MPQKQPKLWVFAGSNGAGKSTLTKRFINGKLEIVNPDILAVQHACHPIEAGRLALHRRALLLSLGKSFALETTLSGINEVKFIAEAKEHGFRIVLFFVYIASPRLALQRIAERVRRGEHDVPAVDVLRRFKRSLEHLPGAIDLANDSFIYDNSKKQRVLLLKRKNKQVTFKNAYLGEYAELNFLGR